MGRKLSEELLQNEGDEGDRKKEGDRKEGDGEKDQQGTNCEDLKERHEGNDSNKYIQIFKSLFQRQII